MAEVLGAVGSVVGIAGFGLQLAHFLNKYVDVYKSAPFILSIVLERVEATHEALDEISGLLQLEKENVIGGGKAQFFSPKALRHVRKTSDKCLKTFWRIESVILQGKTTEDELTTKLEKFHEQLGQATGPVLLQLDRGLKLGKIDKWKWSFSINDKLRDFELQLDRQYSALTLMLQVITLGVNLTRPNIDASLKIHYLVEQIPQTAQHSGIPQVRPRRKSSYLYPAQTNHNLRHHEDPVLPSRYQSHFLPPRMSDRPPQPVDLYKIPLGNSKPRSRSSSRGRSRIVSPIVSPLRRRSLSVEELHSDKADNMRHNPYVQIHTKVNEYENMSNVRVRNRPGISTKTYRDDLFQSGVPSKAGKQPHPNAEDPRISAREQLFTESPTRLSLDDPRGVTTDQYSSPAVPIAVSDMSSSAKPSIKYQKPSVDEQLPAASDNVDRRSEGAWLMHDDNDLIAVDNMIETQTEETNMNSFNIYNQPFSHRQNRAISHDAEVQATADAAEESVDNLHTSSEPVGVGRTRSAYVGPFTSVFTGTSTSTSFMDGTSLFHKLGRLSTGATTPQSTVHVVPESVYVERKQSIFFDPEDRAQTLLEDRPVSADGITSHVDPQGSKSNATSMALILHPDRSSKYEDKPPSHHSAVSSNLGTAHHYSSRKENGESPIASTSVASSREGPAVSSKGKGRSRHQNNHKLSTGNVPAIRNDRPSLELPQPLAPADGSRSQMKSASNADTGESQSKLLSSPTGVQRQRLDSRRDHSRDASSTPSRSNNHHSSQPHVQKDPYAGYTTRRRASPRRGALGHRTDTGQTSRNSRSISPAYTSNTDTTTSRLRKRTRILAAIMNRRRRRTSPFYHDPCLAYLVDNGHYTQIPTDVNAPPKKVFSKIDDTDELCKKYCQLSKQDAAAIDEIVAVKRLGVDWTLKSIQNEKRSRLSVASKDRVLLVVITTQRSLIPHQETLTDLNKRLPAKEEDKSHAGKALLGNKVVEPGGLNNADIESGPFRDRESQPTKSRSTRYAAYTIAILNGDIPASIGGRRDPICQKEHFSQATIAVAIRELNLVRSVLQSKFGLSLMQAMEVDKVIENLQRDDPRDGMTWTLAQVGFHTPSESLTSGRITAYLQECPLEDTEIEKSETRPEPLSPSRVTTRGRGVGAGTIPRPNVTFQDISPPRSRQKNAQPYTSIDGTRRDNVRSNVRRGSTSPLRGTGREGLVPTAYPRDPAARSAAERRGGHNDRTSSLYNDIRTRGTDKEHDSTHHRYTRNAMDDDSRLRDWHLGDVRVSSPYRDSIRPSRPVIIDNYNYDEQDDDDIYPYRPSRLASRVRSDYSDVRNMHSELPMRRGDSEYPEYYDGRSFDVRNVDPEDGAEIVQKLLQNWTPAGAEEKEKKRKEKADDLQDAGMRGRQDLSDDSLDSDADDDWDPYGGARLDATRPGTARSSSFYGVTQADPGYATRSEYYSERSGRQHSIATDLAATRARERAERAVRGRDEVYIERPFVSRAR